MGYETVGLNGVRTKKKKKKPHQVSGSTAGMNTLFVRKVRKKASLVPVVQADMKATITQTTRKGKNANVVGTKCTSSQNRQVFMEIPK